MIDARRYSPIRIRRRSLILGLACATALASNLANPVVAEVDNGNVIATILGTGQPGNGGDGLPGNETGIDRPFDVVANSNDEVYVTDTDNHLIRGVDRLGIAHITAGTGVMGYSGDGGNALDARLNTPKGIELAPDGTIYIADSGNHVIRSISPEGIITTIAGTGSSGSSGDNGPAISAKLNQPHDIVLAPDGRLFIADTNNNRIRVIAIDGTISTFAGNSAAGSSGDGGPATSAQLKQPKDLDVGPTGVVYIADTKNHKIRKVALDGTITTVAGTGASGYLTSQSGGPATSAKLNQPGAIVVNGIDNFYLSDTVNNRIRRVAPNGIITTISGRGSNLDDGGPAAGLNLDHPRGLEIDRHGSLLFADSSHQQIRAVRASDTISPLIDIESPEDWVAVALDEEIFANFGCYDDFSGIASCRATIDGEPTESGTAFDTSTIGAILLEVIAVDNEGNQATVDRFVRVRDPRELTGEYEGATGDSAAVARMYIAIMKRQPEKSGHDFWMEQTEAGKPLEEIAEFFIQSQEFTLIYGDATDSEFVSLLYDNVMSREGDHTGADFWLALLENGVPRLDVAFFFTQSPEFRDATGTF